MFCSITYLNIFSCSNASHDSSQLINRIFDVLTLMLVMANLANTKYWKKKRKNTENLAHGYLSEGTQRELPNEYLNDMA